MVHFNFTVSDEDAFNIFKCIGDQVFKFQVFLFFSEDDNEKKCYKEMINYYEGLIKRMNNIEAEDNDG